MLGPLFLGSAGGREYCSALDQEVGFMVKVLPLGGRLVMTISAWDWITNLSDSGSAP